MKGIVALLLILLLLPLQAMAQEIVINTTCTDTDGGINFHVAGVCKDDTGIYRDYCEYDSERNAYLLHEFYCDTFRYDNKCREARDYETYYLSLIHI